MKVGVEFCCDYKIFMDSQRKLQLFALSESLAGIGHWYIDLVKEKIYWSDQIYVIHGVTPEEYTPELKSAIDFYHPDDRQRVITYVNQAIEQGEDFEFTLRLVQPSGQIRHVRSKAQCQKDDSGQVTQVFGVFLDVTEEITAKAETKEVAAVNKALIDSTDDGYWDWQIDKDYEYMSPRFWDMFGYKPEEKEHHPSAWQDMIFQEDLDIALENFDKHVKTNGRHPYAQQVRYCHKDGSTVTVLCRGKVIEWSDRGEPLRMIGTHTNITNIKKSEQELKDHLNFQRLLLDVNTDLIFVKDEQFRIVSANKAFMSLYPKEMQDKIIGFTTVEEYPPEEAEAFLAEDKKAFADGISEVVETLTMPDGKVHTLLTKKVRFEEASGKPLLLCVARDITQLKKAELALTQANEELESFAYRTSHDLRSPLVSSSRLLEFIQDDLEKGHTEKATRHIKLVRESLSGLEALVGDLLDLTKLQHQTAKKAEVNLNNLVGNSLKKLKHLEGFERIEFNAEYAGIRNPVVEKENIQQIIENLISNAIKYQDPNNQNPFVKISVDCNNSRLSIAVSDNGLGIPDKYHDKLFKMFNRFHTRVSFGSGLGLYMIKKTVDKLKGKVEFEPLNKGVKFTVQVPIEQRTEASEKSL